MVNLTCRGGLFSMLVEEMQLALGLHWNMPWENMDWKEMGMYWIGRDIGHELVA